MAEAAVATTPTTIRRSTTRPLAQSLPAEVPTEHMTATVRRELEVMTRQVYRGLGWTVRAVTPGEPGTTEFRLERDSRVRNRGQLAQLQRQSEAALDAIDDIDTAVTRSAATSAVVAALLGLSLLVGTIIAGQAELATLSLFLGLAAFAVLLLPVPVYHGVRAKRAFHAGPKVDQQLDILRRTAELADTAIGRGSHGGR